MPVPSLPRRVLPALLLMMALVPLGPVRSAEAAVSATTFRTATAPLLRVHRLAGTRWTVRRLSSPARVRVRDGAGRLLATFTRGARTVTLLGPRRTFSEPATTRAVVSHRTWVRLLPTPFSGKVPLRWLRRELADRSPDVLAIALAYTTGRPTVTDSAGTLLSSDAGYGPLLSGTRQEGSDFNDYLGVTWAYGSQTDPPESDQRGDLDCSGFVRMVYGYREGEPLALSPDGHGLPRRSFEMLQSAPGVVTIPDRGTVPSVRKLLPGDLLFWAADGGQTVSHVGVYLGRDSAGAPRFVSSRKTVNGPTMGDVGGPSVLSGSGLYARTWRAARRL